MKVRIFAAFAVMLSFASTFAQAQNAPDEIEWIESYDDAIAEARRTGRPLFLTFRCVP